MIQLHYHSDMDALKLKRFPEEIDVDFLIDQIKGHKKAREKLPEWANNSDVIYPPYLSMEQCSSEFTARRKADFFLGNSILDMTGGMGVDAYFISKHVDHYTLVEQQAKLAAIDVHNFKKLGQDNIKVITRDSVDVLNEGKKYDIIYIDPARRKDTRFDKNSRAFFLEDFRPNVISIYDQLFKCSPNVIIKLAPMLDIRAVEEQLPDTKEIVVIAYKNEVKELLVILSKRDRPRKLIAINILHSNMEEQYFEILEPEAIAIPLANYKKYVYEPNKAILKLQLQNHVGQIHDLEKLDEFTHFFTSEELLKEFPGRIFEVKDELPMKPKSFKSKFTSNRAHVISRNHPLSAEQVRNRFNLTAAGNDYLIACTNMGKKKLLWTTLVT